MVRHQGNNRASRMTAQELSEAILGIALFLLVVGLLSSGLTAFVYYFFIGE